MTHGPSPRRHAPRNRHGGRRRWNEKPLREPSMRGRAQKQPPSLRAPRVPGPLSLSASPPPATPGARTSTTPEDPSDAPRFARRRRAGVGLHLPPAATARRGDRQFAVARSRRRPVAGDSTVRRHSRRRRRPRRRAADGGSAGVRAGVRVRGPRGLRPRRRSAYVSAVDRPSETVCRSRTKRGRRRGRTGGLSTAIEEGSHGGPRRIEVLQPPVLPLQLPLDLVAASLDIRATARIWDIHSIVYCEAKVHAQMQPAEQREWGLARSRPGCSSFQLRPEGGTPRPLDFSCLRRAHDGGLGLSAHARASAAGSSTTMTATHAGHCGHLTQARAHHAALTWVHPHPPRSRRARRSTCARRRVV